MEIAKLAFGPYLIDIQHTFIITKLCYACVNYKPVKPGHSLIIPKRVVPSFTELTPAEVQDMWVTAQRVSLGVNKYYEGTGTTFAIQDGPAAGQTVPHVHIHILPRRPNDFARNDMVYNILEKNEVELDKDKNVKMDKEERKPRDFDDMKKEADILREIMEKI